MCFVIAKKVIVTKIGEGGWGGGAYDGQTADIQYTAKGSNEER